MFPVQLYIGQWLQLHHLLLCMCIHRNWWHHRNSSITSLCAHIHTAIMASQKQQYHLFMCTYPHSNGGITETPVSPLSVHISTNQGWHRRNSSITSFCAHIHTSMMTSQKQQPSVHISTRKWWNHVNGGITETAA